ncbi:MAG: glycine--tRNA ligase [Promethearchaeota archaeon]
MSKTFQFCGLDKIKKMKEEETAKILMLMGHRGFIWGPSPELYNSVKGSFELGPLGKQMKNNLENFLRKKFRKNNFWEVQCPLISPKTVWEASGHVERFFDYIIQCTNPKCNHLFRADTMLEDRGIILNEMNEAALDQKIRENEIKCPDCEGELGQVTTQNLMVTSNLGFPASEYILRPETATTTYMLFPRLYSYFRTSMPILAFQMGYAFRNEISPRKMLLRTREFEQCEGQIFITPEQEMDFAPFEFVKSNHVKLWSAKAQLEGADPENISLDDAISCGILQKPSYAWLINMAYDIVKDLDIPLENIRLRQHKDDEKAHYALDAWDLEINSKLYGWTEVCGVHDRGDYDLGRHFKFSKKKQLKVPGPQKGQKVIPHVLEIAFGVGRLFFFALELAFKFESERNVLDLPLSITPVPFAVFPLQKKPLELVSTAKEIFESLIDNDLGAIMDVAGSIGKRYRRTEEIGVRYAFTIDHQTVEELELDKQTLTIRSIVDMSQKRIYRKDLVNIAFKLLHKDITYDEIVDLDANVDKTD